jgi:hypothetical protein
VDFLPCVQGYWWGGGCWHKTFYWQERSSPKRDESSKGEREGIVVRFWKPTIVYVTTHDDCTPDLERQGSDVWQIPAHSKSAKHSPDSMCTDHPRHYNPMGRPWGKSILSQKALKTEVKTGLISQVRKDAAWRRHSGSAFGTSPK